MVLFEKLIAQVDHHAHSQNIHKSEYYFGYLLATERILVNEVEGSECPNMPSWIPDLR